MTDRELEQRLRAWYAAQLGESDAVPEDLRTSLAEIPATVPAPTRLRPRSRRRGFTLLAVAAVLLVGGALAAGSGLMRLTAVVPPTPSEALLATPTPSTSETPAETASPTASPKAWITGQQLADVLEAEHGYDWKSIAVVLGEGQTGQTLQVERKQQGGSVSISIQSPLDTRATVSVGSELTAAAAVGLHVGRIAEVLAPDSSVWIQGAIARGMSDGGDFADATDTANGGSVGVNVVDEVILQDWISVWFSPEPLPKPRSEPIASDSVVYADSGLIRVVNPDGTDDGALLINDRRVPGATSVARVLGWSSDGSRLIFFDAGGNLLSTDAMGSKPTLIGRAARPVDQCTKLSDAQQARCVADQAGSRDRELCPAVTAGGTCEANLDEALMSSDGTRLAYSISDSGHDMMAFFDIATGQVTRVEFDSASGPACDGPFGGGALQWSPDGTHFAFGNSVGPRVNGWCQGALFTINADGTDLRRITSSKVHALDPRWSPDGSAIVFSRSTPRSAWDGKRDATRIPIKSDIYSVRPDGSGLTALTSDGISISPFWTRDGRILFSRRTEAFGDAELWVMDANGGNATRLDPTIPALTAAGCTVCPFPDGLSRPDPSESDQSGSGPSVLIWRPGQP